MGSGASGGHDMASPNAYVMAAVGEGEAALGQDSAVETCFHSQTFDDSDTCKLKPNTQPGVEYKINCLQANSPATLDMAMFLHTSKSYNICS